MALINCKKCRKIISSDIEQCPYCGEKDPGDTRAGFRPAKGESSYGWFGFVVMALLIILLVQWYFRNDASKPAGEPDTVTSNKATCLAAACQAGAKAITINKQQEPFYTCKSNELSEYANYVLQMMISIIQATGVSPEISGKTGEPVLQGKEKLAIENYRAKAGVASFEEAISKCYRGRAGQKVVVLYSPGDSKSIYVAAEEDPKNKFWLPKSRLVAVSP